MTDSDFTVPRAVFTSMTLRNFLSFADARLEFDAMTAMVGPNASGKSSAVAALKLLHDIPVHGLPSAVARRGGFAQLPRRSPNGSLDPLVRLEFRTFESGHTGFYEIQLRSIQAMRYAVRSERGRIDFAKGSFRFECNEGRLRTWDDTKSPEVIGTYDVAPGQSCLPLAPNLPIHFIGQLLRQIVVVDLVVDKVAEPQLPSSVDDFEPDGSNAVSVFDRLDPDARSNVVNRLAAIVPSIQSVETRVVDDRLTLTFVQGIGEGRGFRAGQMSEGTLRSLAMLVALEQGHNGSMIVIEEPETAIHLAVLRQIVEFLQEYSERLQIVLTTHSADVVDMLDARSIRLVINSNGSSQISRLAPHTIDIVESGTMNIGELLRIDSLDPERV